MHMGCSISELSQSPKGQGREHGMADPFFPFWLEK
jgi:hypothetical protein